MAKIYVANDEKNIRESIASFLHEQGLDVKTFETEDQLSLRFMGKGANVAILDVMIPGADGVEIVTMLRKRSDVPIILLIARDGDTNFVKSFSAGADGYFTKPLSPLKLSLYVRAILAHQPQSQEVAKGTSDIVTYETLTLSEKKRTITYGNQILKLTNTESELLKMLMNHAEEAVSRDKLLHHIWGYEGSIETRVMDDTIKRLRKKPKGVNSHVFIETVWGYGFKLTKKQ